MLSDEDALWLINRVKHLHRELNYSNPSLAEAVRRLDEITKKLEQQSVESLELLIFCPVCKTQHIDEGAFLEPHKRHACQKCGLLFSVTKDTPNVGVQFFKGCRTELHLSTSGTPSSTPGELGPGEKVTVTSVSRF